MRFRIIPLTIVTACLFLMIKIVVLIQSGQALSESLLISRVQAETAPAEGHAADKKEGGEKKEAEKKEGEKKEGDKAEGEKAGAEKKEGEAKEGEHKEGEKKAGEKKPKKDENSNVSDSAGDITERRFTTVELELLQKLTKRREELQLWESNLQIKEATLDATEKRINDKIEQIDAIKKEVTTLLAQYNKVEDAKIASLVKIYENMKPSDAARIFDELEMPVLLLVVDKMSEKKAAPILAAMDPKKAKQVTVELAAQRHMVSANLGAAAKAIAPTTPPSSPAAK